MSFSVKGTIQVNTEKGTLAYRIDNASQLLKCAVHIMVQVIGTKACGARVSSLLEAYQPDYMGYDNSEKSETEARLKDRD